MSEIATPDGANSQLGQCLKAARQARGLTLKQVAERTGMALSTLSKVENGLMSLTYDKLLQLTSGLKMEIAELFNPAPATGVWLGPSWGPDLFDQFRQISSRDVAPVGDEELPS